MGYSGLEHMTILCFFASQGRAAVTLVSCAAGVPALSAGKGEACCTELLLVSSPRQQAALVLSDLSCLFTAWKRARAGCCWGASQRGALAKMECASNQAT